MRRVLRKIVSGEGDQLYVHLFTELVDLCADGQGRYEFIGKPRFGRRDQDQGYSQVGPRPPGH